MTGGSEDVHRRELVIGGTAIDICDPLDSRSQAGAVRRIQI